METVTATPFIDSSVNNCHYMVSHIQIRMVILIDAGTKPQLHSCAGCI